MVVWLISVANWAQPGPASSSEREDTHRAINSSSSSFFPFGVLNYLFPFPGLGLWTGTWTRHCIQEFPWTLWIHFLGFVTTNSCAPTFFWLTCWLGTPEPCLSGKRAWMAKTRAEGIVFTRSPCWRSEETPCFKGFGPFSNMFIASAVSEGPGHCSGSPVLWVPWL